MCEADQLGKDSGLSEEERALYDALADHERAVPAMGSRELPHASGRLAAPRRFLRARSRQILSAQV